MVVLGARSPRRHNHLAGKEWLARLRLFSLATPWYEPFQVQQLGRPEWLKLSQPVEFASCDKSPRRHSRVTELSPPSLSFFLIASSLRFAFESVRLVIECRETRTTPITRTFCEFFPTVRDTEMQSGPSCNGLAASYWRPRSSYQNRSPVMTANRWSRFRCRGMFVRITAH